MKKPPAAFAGGGLGAALLVNPVRQAWFPACALWMLIRIAGIDTPMHGTGKKLVLAAKVCMTLKKVEQSGKGRVKTEDRRGRLHGPLESLCGRE
jgi:hypothetical protein